MLKHDSLYCDKNSFPEHALHNLSTRNDGEHACCGDGVVPHRE